MIGDIVKVIIDRPLGSQHPRYKETYYPINYGFVEGIMAADGKEQDSCKRVCWENNCYYS